MLTTATIYIRENFRGIVCPEDYYLDKTTFGLSRPQDASSHYGGLKSTERGLKEADNVIGG
jgi:hypothetical protein